MEYHQTELQKCCRVCGQRLNSSKAKYKATSYKVEAFQDHLQLAFGFDVRKDVPTVHPRSFCKVCKVAMVRQVEAKTKQIPYKSSVKIYQWEEHKEDCKVQT